MSIKKKIALNFGANAFGQFVTILIQLVSVPLFIHYWGVDVYGEWLTITAIPSYLALSDMGFATVAANEMTMLVAKNKIKNAVVVYQSIWVLVTLVSISFAVFLLLFITAVDVESLLGVNAIKKDSAMVVVVILVVYVLVSMQLNVINAAFRAIGKYATGTSLGNLIRLLEWVFGVVALSCGAQQQCYALVMLGVKVFGALVMLIICRKSNRYMRLGFKWARFDEIKNLYKPAISFMAFPLGLSLSLQGIIIAIGSSLGGSAVVVFSTYRTLTRMLVQVITLLNQSVWPEISTAYGSNKIELVAKMHRNTSSITFWLSFASVIAVANFGQWIVDIWTHHALRPDAKLMDLLLVVAFINVLWQTSWVVLMATNKHQGITIVFISTTTMALVFSCICLPLFGVYGVGVILILAEIPMLYCAINRALKVTNENWPAYLKGVWIVPILNLLKPIKTYDQP